MENKFLEKYKRKMVRNYGFIKDEIIPEHYVFGSGQLSGEILTDGHWISYLTKDELQYNSFIDSYNCTGYGTENCITPLLRRKFLNTPEWNPDFDDFSERVIGIMAHTKPPGNSPHIVAEAIRKNGLVAQKYLPFNETIKSIIEYFSPDPLTKDLVDKGMSFKWGIGHDWVPDHTPEGLKAALCYSPLGVGVFGWQERNGLYYRDEGDPENHWVALVDYVDGKYWIIYDSYLSDNKPLKKLEWNYNFSTVKRYAILGTGFSPANIVKQISIIQKLINLFQQLINMINEKYAKLTKDTIITEPDPVEPAVETPEPPQIDEKPLNRINDIALAIKEFEGWYPGSRSFRNKNPGNLRFSKYTQSLEAIGKDEKNFCIFKCEEIGFGALCQLLTDAFNGLLIPYKKCKTLLDFFKVYAPSSDGNYPLKYVAFVSKKMGIDSGVLLKDLV